MSKSEWTNETAFSKSNDQQIVYTAFGRLMAVVIACGLLLLGAVVGTLDHLLFGGTRIGNLFEELVGTGVFLCLVMALVGRASSD